MVFYEFSQLQQPDIELISVYSVDVHLQYFKQTFMITAAPRHSDWQRLKINCLVAASFSDKQIR